MAKQRESVDRFLSGLKHAKKDEIEAVRTIILRSNRGITEHIKWNAPSFCFKGDDRVTMRLQPKDRLELIFHRGVKVKETRGFEFKDSTVSAAEVVPVIRRRSASAFAVMFVNICLWRRSPNRASTTPMATRPSLPMC